MRACYTPFLPGYPRKPSDGGAFPQRGSKCATGSIWGEDGRAEVSGVQSAAGSQSQRLHPAGGLRAPTRALVGEVRTERSPSLERDSFVAGGELDSFQLGRLRLSGKVTTITQPDANLNPVRLVPESVVSPLLSSSCESVRITHEYAEA